MAKALITTTRPNAEGSCEALLSAAVQDRFHVHSMTQDPRQADIILFVESWGVDPYFKEMRRHPLVRRYREKCFCFCELDHALPFLPGLYTHAPRPFYRPSRVRTGFYLAMFRNPYVSYCPDLDGQPHLFGFIGTKDTSSIRDRLFQLNHPRALLLDVSQETNLMHRYPPPPEIEPFRERYAQRLKSMKFVLCPRGRCPSSVRLFEAMQTGRAPVIISDDWVAPPGPDWDACSVRVAESQIESIPGLLETLEPRAGEMGREARRQWEDWFAPNVQFHRIVDWCLQIKAERRWPESVSRADVLRYFLSPGVRRTYLRFRLGPLKTRVRQLIGGRG
jgi:hypothetical protein